MSLSNKSSNAQRLNQWYVYIIYCSDDSLYTGITTDVERRYKQHATQRGAKYFRGRQPKQVVYLESNHDRSSASKREIKIKKMLKVEKIKLIASTENQLKECGKFCLMIVVD